jgi:hypothetical protein
VTYKPASEWTDPAPDPSHHRLDRTITLGASEATATAYDAPVASGDARGTTIVNVYINQPGMGYGTGYGYGGYYGYGYASPLVASPRMGFARGQAPVALRPGLDWPAVPNAGPAFPYRTAPASPWDGAGRRR